MVFLTIKGVWLDMTEKKRVHRVQRPQGSVRHCTPPQRDRCGYTSHGSKAESQQEGKERKPREIGRGDDGQYLPRFKQVHACRRTPERRSGSKSQAMNVKFLETRFESQGGKRVVVVIHKTGEFEIPKGRELEMLHCVQTKKKKS